MPSRDFDSARRAFEVDRDPVEFTLGGEHFAVRLEPSLGDTFDLYDAPDVRLNDDGTINFDADNGDDVQLVQILSQFIERSLPIEDRARWQRALYRIPATQAHVIIQAALFIVEQVTTHPSEPPANSSSGRQPTGPNSKPVSAGTPVSS